MLERVKELRDVRLKGFSYGTSHDRVFYGPDGIR